MEHEEAQRLLADRSHGRLAEAVQRDLAAHLSACGKCGSLSETYEMLRASLATAAVAEHPTSEEIVAYALRSGDLTGEDLARLAAHARACDPCAGEVAAVAEADAAAGSLGGRPPSGFLRFLLRPGPAAALTAAGLLLVMGYPAFLGLVRLPELRRAQQEAQDRVAALTGELDGARRSLQEFADWDGPAQWLTLRRPRRGEAPRNLISLQPDQPYLQVAVRPLLGEEVQDDARFLARIEDEDGREIWAAELRASQIREHVAADGVVVLPVRSALLPPGGYRFRLVSSERTEVEPAFEASFQILPPPVAP